MRLDLSILNQQLEAVEFGEGPARSRGRGLKPL